jgi:hypothetical protein
MRFPALALVLGLTGCVTYPCDTDVLACEDGEALQIDPSCDAEGDLSLVACENGSDMPLPEDAWPIVHHGAQGAVHFSLAVQMDGIDPDHRQVELELRVEACDDEACDDPSMLTSRTLVADEDVLESDGDTVELHDIVLVLDDEPPAEGRLVLEARDACGREASQVLRAGG